MSDDKDSKTEEPTSKRLDEARKEGQVPNSREVSHVAALLGALIFVVALLPWAAGRITEHMAIFLSRLHVFPVRPDSLGIGITELLWTLAPYMVLTLSLFVVLALLAQIGQVGLLFTAKPMQPKLDKISPIKGFTRVFSVKQLLEVAKGLPKIGLVGLIAYFVLLPILRRAESVIDQPVLASLQDLHEALITLLVGTLLFMVAIAVFDWIYTQFKHRKDLRMTKQEIKDEHKSTEGDPQVKARIRSLRAERSRQRMMQAVPDADVVVTNPTHFAVALKYDMQSMAAPRLVAKGQDHLALRIRDLAEEHDVPLVENPPLARALYAAVDLDQEIPPEHYQAVAEVIGYVMRLKKKFQ
ncbi:flagellar biosynthesis protein FlhB [Roseospira goensis]|uniref:Flagellar biosynthetic protein FlhB n=1 Tax=Roseospira goensis TaxID=391922 RepID=A0A7W6WKY7_9PROT|nr:flagellar biosynthesis protein FlhB [Roseospira goensis]MBB4286153.1 flagellar biosynthetic protein FlhB [Roseospira goensis]